MKWQTILVFSIAAIACLLPDSTTGKSYFQVEAEKLLKLDKGGRYIPMSLEGQRLFDADIGSMSQWKTITMLKKLLDGYTDVNINNFLEEVKKTKVMTALGLYLGYSPDHLRTRLDEIWFTSFTLGSKNSSGFQHVFKGEIKGVKMSGFHNWINFMREENNGNLNVNSSCPKIVYKAAKVQIIEVRCLMWSNVTKPVTTMFVGTTPELELALYTLCFLIEKQGSGLCDGGRFKIQIWANNSRETSVIESAYPKI